MELTKTERALFANQNRILALLNENNSADYIMKAEILEKGYEGMYDDCFEQIYEGVSKEVCEETHDILNMYRVINNLIASLTPEDQATLDLEKIKFEGFDANNDKHYDFMTFLVEKAGLYNEYQNAYLNSHSRILLDKYKMMYEIYQQQLKSNEHRLNFEGLRNIINGI